MPVLPAPIVIAQPAKKLQKKKKKKKAEDENDEDMEAFLMEQAKKEAAEGTGQLSVPKKATQPPPKKKPHVRKAENGPIDQTKQIFGRESKNELKRHTITTKVTDSNIFARCVCNQSQ
jgi:hypothetical protein